MKMKSGLVGLAALMLAAAAPLIQGDPIPDREIILDEDPGNAIISGTTDRSGGVLLSAQPGRYALKLPNAQTLRVPAVARIEIGRTVLTTGPIQPGGRGDVYFMGRDGRRLTFMVPRGARVRVVLTEGAQGDTGTNPEGRAGARVDPRIPPPQANLPPPGDFDGDGRADARTDPRIPPPAPRTSGTEP